MYFCIESGIGTRDGVSWLWCALDPSMVCSAVRPRAMVPVLLFVALWFILRGDLFYVLPCVILFLCFQSF